MWMCVITPKKDIKIDPTNKNVCLNCGSWKDKKEILLINGKKVCKDCLEKKEKIAQQ